MKHVGSGDKPGSSPGKQALMLFQGLSMPICATGKCCGTSIARYKMAEKVPLTTTRPIGIPWEEIKILSKTSEYLHSSTQCLSQPFPTELSVVTETVFS